MNIPDDSPAAGHRAPPRVALIGLGGYGQAHLGVLNDLARSGQCRIESAVALPSTSAADLAGLSPQVRRYPHFDDWLQAERGRFDLCCLPTPIHLHASMARAALAAGGSVLVEKPLAASWEEVTGLLEARPAPGHFLAVGYHDFCTDDAYGVKRRLLAGEIGTVRRIHLLGLWPRPDAYYQRNAWAGRLRLPEGAVLDSPLNNALAHYFLLALFFAGETLDAAGVLIEGTGELYRFRDIESFDTAALRLKTQGGVEILAAVTHRGTVESVPLVRMEGDWGAIEWHAGREIHIESASQSRRTLPLRDAAHARLALFSNLLTRLQGNSALLCSARLAAVHSACILDLHAGCPIHDAPELARAEPGHAAPPRGPAIDLETDLRRVVREGRLPSELGLPWSRPATRFPTPHSQLLAQRTA